MAVDDTPAAVLPCGRDPLAAPEHARAGQLDGHEQDCPYCQAAIAEDWLISRAARELAAEPVEVPPTLLPAVMRTVWAELRPSPLITLPVPGGGAAVTTLAITGALRHGLDQIPGLTVRSCQAAAGPAEDGTASIPAPLAIQITGTAAWPSELPVLAEQARQIVTDTLGTQFGLHPASIDINFTDLDLPDSP
jgi:hypothetical protein